ncbi:hypothetical protein Y032_0009g651 [Ancylostoma ceylanicum]|uniref:Uncharacterized protein n=1 Tax=Ancylostoma ceylanicum TaxID=53326 RepID=A0A016VKM3_9BILA|nr:hypothetical protein Y032_0009g651 [Ancylostoma ceylanicum]
MAMTIIHANTLELTVEGPTKYLFMQLSPVLRAGSIGTPTIVFGCIFPPFDSRSSKNSDQLFPIGSASE